MKKILTILALICAVNSYSQTIKKVNMDEVVKMIDTSTTPLIVNFWASWCKPCVHEIPWFEQGVKAYADKNIKLVLVSLDFAEDYPKNLQEFVKRQNYSATILWLNETNADSFCPKIDSTWSGSIPATIMVNNKTHYRQFFGEQIPEPRFKLELAKLVE